MTGTFTRSVHICRPIPHFFTPSISYPHSRIFKIKNHKMEHSLWMPLHFLWLWHGSSAYRQGTNISGHGGPSVRDTILSGTQSRAENQLHHLWGLQCEFLFKISKMLEGGDGRPRVCLTWWGMLDLICSTRECQQQQQQQLIIITTMTTIIQDKKVYKGWRQSVGTLRSVTQSTNSCTWASLKRADLGSALFPSHVTLGKSRQRGQ